VNRIDTLFALASLLLLAFGLFVSRLKEFGISFVSGNVSYGFRPQFILYGIAGLFAIFACLNFAGYIPFNKTTIQWHFWLSVVSVALFIAGFIWLGFAGLRSTTHSNLGLGAPSWLGRLSRVFRFSYSLKPGLPSA
jgi:hypothetical protein